MIDRIKKYLTKDVNKQLDILLDRIERLELRDAKRIKNNAKRRDKYNKKSNLDTKTIVMDTSK